jgi:hypothetical protein
MEQVGQFSTGPVCVVRKIALNQAGEINSQGYIRRFNCPNHEANRVGFGFCSRATLECPNDKSSDLRFLV